MPVVGDVKSVLLVAYCWDVSKAVDSLYFDDVGEVLSCAYWLVVEAVIAVMAVVAAE